MYSLFQIYKSPNLLPFQLTYNSNDWKWDIYAKQAENNVIPSFFTQSTKHTGTVPTVTSFTVRKLDVTELKNGNLTVLDSFTINTSVLKVKETTDGYYSVYLPNKYQSTEIDKTKGIFQLYFEMSDSTIFYSDLICLKGTPVPSFTCSLADLTDDIFTIRVTRTDSETEAENTGTLTVNLYEDETLIASVLQEFEIEIGNFLDLTYDFTDFETGKSIVEWEGVCAGELIPVTFDNTGTTWDSTNVTFDEIFN